ncbi:glycosyltransferase family 2 protein [Myxosarcina sp. GI1(2024)]
MFMLPKVSVIIPAYNVNSYLEATLISLERQSFKQFEALIVDDGSTDDTALIAQSFCRRDRRFRLLQKPNGGLSSARNYGIERALGEYIALLDGDDLYHPDKLTTHVELLDGCKRVGVVYSASRAIRNDGRRTFMVLDGKPINLDPLVALLCKNFIGHGSNAVLRRCIFPEVGLFDETLRSCEDIDFWLRIATTRRWDFHLLPQILCSYRVRPSGLSFNVKQMEECYQRVIQTASRLSPEVLQPWLPTANAYMHRYLARVSIAAGERYLARDYLKRAWVEDAAIFYRDWRAFLTAIAILSAPLAQLTIRQTLGVAESVSE